MLGAFIALLLLPMAACVKKQITLIRHAQSLENVAVSNTMRGLASIVRLRAPTREQLGAARGLVFHWDRDADVSELGHQQIENMHSILRQNVYWEKFVPSVVYCSTLTRAKKTCLGVMYDEEHRENIRYLDCLVEATPYELLISKSIKRRILEFENILLNTPGDNIVVVGHSQYFRRMLKMKKMLRNCDVLRAEVEFDEEGQSQWKDLTLVHRSEFAQPNPWRSGRDFA